MKKKLAMLMAVLMLASTMLAACGEKDTDNKQSSDDKTAEKTVTTDEDGRKMIGNMYTEGLPIVKEKEKFTIFVDDNGQAEDKIMYPLLEEQTNVEVELLLYPYDTAREKKNILINSGDYPDAFGGWILGEKDILRDGMEEGLYIPIDDYIEKYAPKISSILDIKGVRQTMTLPDNHIYTIPYVNQAPAVDFSPFINRDWLKAVDMEMPTTTEEFREVLRAFKTKDPNGNNEADEIPFTSDPNNINIESLAGWFGVSSTQKQLGFRLVDGKLESIYNKEGYKETIKYLNSLYEEGLIDPEIFTHDLSQWKAKGEANIIGCSMAYGSGDYVTADVATNTTQYDPLPVLKSDYCENPNYYRNSYGVDTLKTQIAITDKAKHPEVIVRWFDNVFELENSVQIQAGLLGKRIEKVAEGQYRYLDETKLSEAERKKYEWGNMFTQSLPHYVPADFKILPIKGQKEKYDEKKVLDKLYEPYLYEEVIPKAWASAEDSKRLSVIQTDIKNYMEKKNAEWISGQADIEEQWDEHVKQLDKLGLQELTDIRNNAISNVPAE